MAREVAKRELMRLIAEHDGELYWYQLDRAISGLQPHCIGPFREEIVELTATGLIEVRLCPELPGGARYWLTDAGWAYNPQPQARRTGRVTRQPQR